jgi:SAM-dependent methyltransferase
MNFEEKFLAVFVRRQGGSKKTNLTEWSLENSLSNLIEVFPGFLERIRGKSILDFGCGLGYQSVALARSGAKSVVGVDTSEKNLLCAVNLSKSSSVEDRVVFEKDLFGHYRESFDIAISQNSFEHFSEPFQVLEKLNGALKPGGKLFITFGPPWMSPWGSHMGFLFKLPWAHLFFSERAVMGVRSRFKSDGAKRYEDVEGGLNKMTIARFEDIIASLGMVIKYKRYDCLKKLNILGKFPLVRELFINRVSCVLTK